MRGEGDGDDGQPGQILFEEKAARMTSITPDNGVKKRVGIPENKGSADV